MKMLKTHTLKMECVVSKEDGFVDKYPMVNIFRVRESY